MPTQAERQTADCEHYHGRCPTSNNTKQGEDDEWEEHDGIRKADQEWVTKVNAANIKRMRQELVSGIPKAGSTVEADPIWEALVDFPITLTMSKLLNLVPRFRQAMEARLQAPHKTIPALFTETNLGPTIIDHRSPAIKALVHGTEIQGCVVDGGSGVNVIRPHALP